ncbi:MAG TPA: transglycosylase SLT domain-containing protein [Ktedonobacterales bacterium]|nr:transglycosylase SLT domain-containing protein [Ktedonobacterales bacterium]
MPRAVFGVLAAILVLSGMLLALTGLGRGLVGAERSAGPTAHEATSTPQPTPTATLVPLPDFSLPAFCGASSGASQTGCVHCPYTYSQTQYSRAQVQAALDAAANQYQLPQALVYAIAWGESNWHSGFMTCNYDLGVMQLKQGYLASFDNLQEPAAWCPGIARTLYDPIGSMQENVMLGAKWLAWLRCYYGWMAAGGGSQTAPDNDTLAWYYRQAGKSLPDTSAAASLCASTAQDPTKPWFKDLGAEATDLWSCPFSAQAGDRTFLDIVIAGYNGGPQAMSGTIPNDGYVSYIEGIMAQFAQGQLPA